MSLPTIVATDTDEMLGSVAGSLSASVQTGDLLVVFGGDNDDGSGTAEFTPSDDQSNSYTAVGNALNSGLSNPSSSVFRAFAGSTGTVTITMTHTNEGDGVAACGLIVFRGADPTTPIPHVTDLGDWTGANNSITVPAAGSLNITTNDCIVVAFMNSQAGSRTFSGGITWGNTLANESSLALKTNWRVVYYGEQATAATQTATVADDETDASRYTGHLFAVAGASGGDVTAPTLSSPTDTTASSTTGTGSVDTDEGNGTLYWVVTTSATSPSAAQVKAGNDHTGSAAVDSGSQAVSGTGTQNVSGGFTGLTPSTTYYAHYMHEDSSTNQSTVSSADGFTTNAASSALPIILQLIMGG